MMVMQKRSKAIHSSGKRIACSGTSEHENQPKCVCIFLQMKAKTRAEMRKRTTTTGMTDVTSTDASLVSRQTCV